MKRIITLIALVYTIGLNAQEKETENNPIEMKEASLGNYIDTANKKVEAFIKLMGDEKTPWLNQRIVKALDKDKAIETTEKIKFNKLNKSDILGYSVGNRTFKLIEFVNIRASIVSNKDGKEASMFDQIQSVKNMTKQKHFAEMIVDGKYKIYKLYGYPKDFDIQQGDEGIKAAEEELNHLRTSPSLLLQIDNEKIEFIKIEDLEKIAKVCDVVAKKLEKGEFDTYGYQKPKKVGLMGKMAKLANNQHNGNAQHEKLFIAFFNDLNLNCK
jgi:hypothetical protein